MMNLLREHNNSMMAMHAAIATLIATAVVGVGALLGFATADLYEVAHNWVVLT